MVYKNWSCLLHSFFYLFFAFVLDWIVPGRACRGVCVCVYVYVRVRVRVSINTFASYVFVNSGSREYFNAYHRKLVRILRALC